MSLDVIALRESFALVVERSPTVTTRFYEIFFERYPQVRPMFGTGRQARQEQMLTQALVAVIEHLEDPRWLQETLRGLGAKHVAYGVTDEMYGWVGESLLAALAEVLGAEWTPRVEDAWKGAFAAIAGAMLAGAHDAARAA